MPSIYISSVTGALVPRFPTLRASTVEYIGATRVAANKVEWNEGAIVLIPEQEFNLYRREYMRALKAEDLVLRTEAEYEAQNKQPPPAAKSASVSANEGTKQ